MLVKREKYLEKIRSFYEVDLIKVLTGVRRSGKSVLLKQIEEEILDGGIDKDHIIVVDFENIKFENIRTTKKLNIYIQKKIIDDKKYYIFLDEIQHVRSFEKILSSLRTTLNCSIFVTGSNSKLLSGKLATLLVGRCIEFRVQPFTFSEVCEYHKVNNIEYNEEELFYNYLNWGGMPLRFSFQSESDILNYLRQTYNGIIDKDIVTERSKINKENFTRMANYVMANAGKEFSSENIETYFEVNNQDTLDKKTVYRYLDKMEKACLISRVKRFDISGKKAMKYIEKQYAVDTGFRMINTNFVNFEDTFFLENIVYNELVSRGYEIFTGKTYKGEVDFVALDGRKKCFIQVAYLLSSSETIEREFGAYKPITDAAPKYVMSLDRVDYSRDGISHINLIDFLLNKKEITML